MHKELQAGFLGASYAMRNKSPTLTLFVLVSESPKTKKHGGFGEK